jgi:hypothetical protein
MESGRTRHVDDKRVQRDHGVGGSKAEQATSSFVTPVRNGNAAGILPIGSVQFPLNHYQIQYSTLGQVLHHLAIFGAAVQRVIPRPGYQKRRGR